MAPPKSQSSTSEVPRYSLMMTWRPSWIRYARLGHYTLTHPLTNHPVTDDNFKIIRLSKN